MMRSVSFVERQELDFSGNHFSQALCLGDVDGDGVGRPFSATRPQHELLCMNLYQNIICDINTYVRIQ